VNSLLNAWKNQQPTGKFLAAAFVVSGDVEEKWETTWTDGNPSKDNVPAKVVMTVIDDIGQTHTAEESNITSMPTGTTWEDLFPSDWGELADTSWYNDSQTSFTISNAAELAGLAELVNSGTNFSGKTINLGADIDLLELEWIPIGTSEHSFRGTFDGKHHTISNLKIRKPAENYKGLFGVIGTGTVIKDMSMKDVNITGYGWLGAVAGWHENSSTLTIDNVDVTDITLNGHRMIGGVLGQSYNGAQAEIKDCDLTNVTINNSVRDKNGNGDKSGGIVGHAGSIKLTSNSVTNLNLYAYRDSGGITGYSETLSNISGNIVTTGNLRLDKTQEMATGEAVDNKWNLGAIVGRPRTKTQVLGEGNSFDEVTSSIKEKHDEDFRVIETVEVGYTPITVEESGSIQAAIDAADAGDTILVGEGTYRESLIIPSGKEGLVLKSVSGADATVIDGNIALGADNITIEGFTIGNSGARNGYVGLEGTDGSKITNNIINGSKATVSIGNTTGNTVDSVTIEGNTIHGGTIGLYPTSGSTITISNNTIDSGNGEIIWIHGAEFKPTSLSLDIQGNIAIQEGDVITIHFKPVSINGVVDELDMISTIRNDNEPVKVVLGWVKTVGATDADFTTIQDAVNGVNGGDTILVKAGTYTADNTNPITINKKVTLMGDNALINVSTGNQPLLNIFAFVLPFQTRIRDRSTVKYVQILLLL
jgi:parallel beta-helix repeat protein